MARRTQAPEPVKPGNGRVPAQEAVPAAAEPEAEPERLKLTSLERLEPGRPAGEINGRVFHFANPIALGALARHRLGELYEHLGTLSETGISTPELEREHLEVLVELAGIALPGFEPGELRALGDVQLDGIAGAFFVEAARVLPTVALGRLFTGKHRTGTNSSRGSRGSTGTRKRGS